MKSLIIRKNLLIGITMIATIFLLSCQTPKEETTLNAIEFDQSMKNETKGNFVLLDVRTPEEFSEGHLQEAIDIDYNNPAFTSNITKLDKNKTVYVYCRSGRRSAEAASIMRSSGFKKVIELDGGILAWEDAHLTVVK